MNTGRKQTPKAIFLVESTRPIDCENVVALMLVTDCVFIITVVVSINIPPTNNNNIVINPLIYIPAIELNRIAASTLEFSIVLWFFDHTIQPRTANIQNNAVIRFAKLIASAVVVSVTPSAMLSLWSFNTSLTPATVTADNIPEKRIAIRNTGNTKAILPVAVLSDSIDLI